MTLINTQLLRKYSNHYFVSITGLALAVWLFIIIFSYVRFESSYDTYHKRSDQLFRLLAGSESQYNFMQGAVAWQPAPLFQHIESLSGINNISRMHHLRNARVAVGDKVLTVTSIAADPSLEEILNISELQGSLPQVLNNAKLVAISESKAQALFGTIDVLGRGISLRSYKNHGEFIIQSVFADIPKNSSYRPDILVQFDGFITDYQAGDLNNWYNNNYHYLLRIDQPQEAEIIAQQITETASKNTKASAQRFYQLQPFTDVHLNRNVRDSLSHPPEAILSILIVAAIFVLLMSCVNYVNNTIAQSFYRSKEIGVRKILGASRLTVLWQFIKESGLIFGLSFLLAALLAHVTMPYLNLFFAIGIPEFSLLEFAPELLGLATITILVTSLYPALLLSALNPLSIIKKSGGSSGNERKFLRSALTGFQFVIAFGLLASVLIVGNQVNYLLTAESGYNTSQIINLDLRGKEMRDRASAFKNELATLPGVQEVSITSHLPHKVQTQQGRIWKSGGEEETVSFFTLFADESFMEVYGVKILEGRFFQPGTNFDRNSYLINEAAAREYGWDDPVGMEFVENQDTVRIIGLVKDFHYKSMHNTIAPMRIGHTSKGWVNKVSIKYNTSSLEELLPALSTKWTQFNPVDPFEYSFLDEDYANMYSTEQAFGALISLFSIIAMIIAVTGLYGMLSLDLNRQIREMAIRNIHGASYISLSKLLMRKYLLLFVVSGFASVPLSIYFLQDWLAIFAYHISIGPMHFVFAAIILAAILIASATKKFVQLYRLNAIEILRYD